MPVLLISAAAVLAGAGTRLAAPVLVACSVAAAFDPDPAGAVVVWLAATGAGLLVLGAAPRRMALPLAGVAAVVAAGAATNGALVVPLWLVSSVSAVASVHPEGRTWGIRLLMADGPIVVGVGLAALGDGLVAWPLPLDGAAAALVAVGALVRAPLAAGPDDRAPEAGVLVVRSQVFVGLVMALGGTVGPTAARGAVIAGAVAFAAGPLASRTSVRDGVQEAGLIAVVVSAASLGWLPEPWVWGAAAAGTLVHLARLAAPRRGAASGVVASLSVAGGLGTPLLPVVVAVVAGSADGGLTASVLAAGLVVGLALRVAGVVPTSRGARSVTVVAVVGLAAAAGSWMPLLLPPGASGPPAWPPWWALVLVGIGAVGGVSAREAIAPARTRRRPAPALAWGRWTVRGPSAPRWVPVLLGAWAVLAAAIWGLGFVRGFL